VTPGILIEICGVMMQLSNEVVILRNTFTNCFKYNELSFGGIDNQSMGITEFFSGIEAGSEYCGDNLNRRISIRTYEFNNRMFIRVLSPVIKTNHQH